MLIESESVLKFIFMPLISAQLLLVVLVYFYLVRKHISDYYKWYFCFISTVIFFLLGRSTEFFFDAYWANLVLYARVSLLFALGIPCLVVASAIYTGTKKTPFVYGMPFVLGILFACLYVLLADCQRQLLLSASGAEYILVLADGLKHQTVQLTAIIVLLVLPSCYFLIKAFIDGKNIKDFTVILGGLLFGLLFAIGSKWGEVHWIYYVGSFIPALCWAWVVFKDVHDMQSKVNLVKDELYSRARSGDKLNNADVDSLLSEIEYLSSNNLTVYKLRLREVLTRLTDNTIEAGGDTENILQRYSAQDKAIEAIKDVEQLRQVARDEVVELSSMLSDIPKQRIERVKQHIATHYQQDIDINQLAEQVNVSRSYLMREFKKLTGKTVNQYLTEYRIELAKQLLITESVTDTAFAVGFNNSNYFSTVFKKITGKSPVQFQQVND
ncbi:helix-turn-helix transcriptional regulator [Paraglaciecola sp.]|uniref:AraC family transcriptional regulator n=1 Tax=Paraglaciecola sp. TaxID=1920173 RepID=UPI003EFA0C30